MLVRASALIAFQIQRHEAISYFLEASRNSFSSSGLDDLQNFLGSHLDPGKLALIAHPHLSEPFLEQHGLGLLDPAQRRSRNDDPPRDP